MKRQTHISMKTKLLIDDMTKRQDVIRYNISMAIIASFLIAISTLAILCVTLLSKGSVDFVYAAVSIVMIPLFFVYMNAYNSAKKLTKHQLNIVQLFPYIVITFGALINYVTADMTFMIPPFLLVILSISFIHLMTVPRLIRVYSFAFFLLCMLNLTIYSFNNEFIIHLMIGTIIIAYASFFSFIQIKSYLHNHQVSHELEDLNENQKEYIQRLTKIHEELQQNSKITEAMMKISAEVIKLNQFDEVLKLIMDEAIKLIPKAQSGSILIYNGIDMEFRAVSGYDLKLLSQIHLTLDNLYQSTLDDMYEPAIIDNLEVFDEAVLNKDQFNKMKENGALIAKSILTCCFQYDGKLFGCLNLDNFDGDIVFEESDKKMIKYLTKHIEVAVTIHNLYEEALKPTRYDELTQVYSRRYMDFVLNKAMNEATKKEEPISICEIDLNDLKYVNDLLGHSAGDQYLQYFVDMAKKTLPDSTILARVGGDEFIFGFPDLTKNQATDYVNELRSQLCLKPFHSKGVNRIITFGCGIAMYPDDSKSLDELIKLADLRMYLDKNSQNKEVEDTKLL